MGGWPARDRLKRGDEKYSETDRERERQRDREREVDNCKIFQIQLAK